MKRTSAIGKAECVTQGRAIAALRDEQTAIAEVLTEMNLEPPA